MKASRIYIIGHGQDIRLVRANHRSQALAHVAKSMLTIGVANQDQLVSALTKGVTVESVSEAETGDMFEEGQAAAA